MGEETVIGRRLKAARRAAGLTQRALSERIGGLVSDVAISKYEADRDMPSSKDGLADPDRVAVDHGRRAYERVRLSRGHGLREPQRGKHRRNNTLQA
jgi:DNA-binding XRE family transcriptional regulator